MLRHSVQGDVIVPRFLADDDHPWLRLILDEVEASVGKPRRELDERLRTVAEDDAPSSKRALAVRVLSRLLRTEAAAAVDPRTARATLFRAAAGTFASRDAVVDRVAAELAITPAALVQSLFADLPGERIVTLPDPPSPAELALRINLALAQAYLARARAISLHVEGNARALVRLAKLRGLICSVTAHAEADADADARDATLEISGPFSLFRHTLVYGRALGELLPLCAWSRRFRLRADCVIDGRKAALTLASGDPIFPAPEPRRYDSQLEERFARAFRRHTKEWELIREPEALRAGASLIFPDFALLHRAQPTRRWLLELIGFWTPDYLARKLAQYRAAGVDNLILCIDETLDCAPGSLPPTARILRFRKRIDPAAVLALLGECDTSTVTVRHLEVSHST